MTCAGPRTLAAHGSCTHRVYPQADWVGRAGPSRLCLDATTGQPPRTNVRWRGGRGDHHSHEIRTSSLGSGCKGCRSTGCWPWTRPNGPRPQTLYGPGRPHPHQHGRRYRPALAGSMPAAARAGRANHHGHWLYIRPPGRHAWLRVHTATRCVMLLPETALRPTGPSPHRPMSGAIGAAHRTIRCTP